MELNTVPRFASGCRLHPAQDVLLIPEGTLELTGPARDVAALVDGQRTVQEIVRALTAQYEGAQEQEMLSDVQALLNRLEQRGVLRS